MAPDEQLAAGKRPAYNAALRRFGMETVKPSRGGPPIAGESGTRGDQPKGASTDDTAFVYDTPDALREQLRILAAGIIAKRRKVESMRAVALAVDDEVFRETDRLLARDIEHRMAVRALILKSTRATARSHEAFIALDAEVWSFIDSIPEVLLPSYAQTVKQLQFTMKRLKTTEQDLHRERKGSMLTGRIYQAELRELESVWQTDVRDLQGQLRAERRLFLGVIAEMERQHDDDLSGLRAKLEEHEASTAAFTLALQVGARLKIRLADRLKAKARAIEEAKAESELVLNAEISSLHASKEKQRIEKEAEVAASENLRQFEGNALFGELDRLRRLQVEALKAPTTAKAHKLLYSESLKPIKDPRDVTAGGSSLSWRASLDGEQDAGVAGSGVQSARMRTLVSSSTGSRQRRGSRS